MSERATSSQIEEVVQKIGRKLAEERGLSSYFLIYAPRPPKGEHKVSQGFRVVGGVRPVILLCVSIKDPDFQRSLTAAFNDAAASKCCGAVEVQSKMLAMRESVRELIPELPPEPEELAGARLSIQIVRRVVITDKVTGLVSVQEAPEQRKDSKSWSALIKLGKQELARLVELVERAKEREGAHV